MLPAAPSFQVLVPLGLGLLMYFLNFAVVESFVMSAWHNGALRTMKANYYVQQKDLRVIRPLVLLSRYSYSYHMHIPSPVSPCIRILLHLYPRIPLHRIHLSVCEPKSNVQRRLIGLWHLICLYAAVTLHAIPTRAKEESNVKLNVSGR